MFLLSAKLSRSNFYRMAVSTCESVTFSLGRGKGEGEGVKLFRNL